MEYDNEGIKKNEEMAEPETSFRNMRIESVDEDQAPSWTFLKRENVDASLDPLTVSNNSNFNSMDSNMMNPLLLIESKNDGLHLNQEAIRMLQSINNNVVVIGIIGTYRSGKSYLLNCLVGKQTDGFELGDSVTAHTKGIWIWCHPHPWLKDTTLVYMDSEGLEDPDKNDNNYDMKIMTLSLLLSSTLLYNTKGQIDNGLVEKLGFVSQLTKHVHVKSGQDEKGGDFDVHFPVLAVVIRDFYLKLVINKQPVSATEYFNSTLTLREKGTSAFNEPRMRIRQFFPSRKRYCFVLPIPTPNFSWMSTLHLAPKPALNPKFVSECQELKSVLLNISSVKTVGNMQTPVTGRMLADLAKCYVETLQKGAIPSIESALRLTALNENRRLLQECLEQYKSEISSISMPMSETELFKTHKAIVQKMMTRYREKIIFEDISGLKDDLQDKLATAYNEAIVANESASTIKCKSLLVELYQPISQNIQDFLKPGGYTLYSEATTELKMKYKRTPNKGVKSETVLFEFLQEKEQERSVIIAADLEYSVLAAKEEGLAREKEQIELREKMFQEELERSRQRELELKEINEETAKNLKLEMEERLRRQDEEFQRVLEERQENYAALERELRDKIEGLETKIKSKNDPACIIF